MIFFRTLFARKPQENICFETNPYENKVSSDFWMGPSLISHTAGSIRPLLSPRHIGRTCWHYNAFWKFVGGKCWHYINFWKFVEENVDTTILLGSFWRIRISIPLFRSLTSHTAGSIRPSLPLSDHPDGLQTPLPTPTLIGIRVVPKKKNNLMSPSYIQPASQLLW